jgi:hypothetical protein
MYFISPGTYLANMLKIAKFPFSVPHNWDIAFSAFLGSHIEYPYWYSVFTWCLTLTTLGKTPKVPFVSSKHSVTAFLEQYLTYIYLQEHI